jgi:hypothetical protein
MPWPLYFTTQDDTQYALYRRRGGLCVQSGWMQKILPLLGFDPRTIETVASHYTDYPVLVVKENRSR